MLNKKFIELNKCWVCEHLCDVTDIETKKAAWVLLQEPGFIGFGVVQSDKIGWPPNIPENSPDWTLTSDLRLFGEKGEWHVWRDWDGKHYGRLLELKNINDDRSITEYHALWGTKIKNTDTHPWIKVVEDRGAEIRLPLVNSKLDEELDLPLRLKLKQVVGYDPESHLAGITDAVLVALVNSEKEVLPPPLLSCP